MEIKDKYDATPIPRTKFHPLGPESQIYLGCCSILIQKCSNSL